MLNKFNIYLILAITFTIFLIGCTNKTALKHLTRVDVEVVKEDESYEPSETIVDEDKIKKLRKIFDKIEWSPNAEAKLASEEDVKATLFFEYDKNMPERLVEYEIWFVQNQDFATIISNNEKEGLGLLERKYALTLEDLLLNR